MTTSVQLQDKPDIQASDVENYLLDHPDFFLGREHLLEDLKLPHQSGAAISLVERQISLFREQRDQYEHQLMELVDIARQNDRFFEKSKRLLLNLMEADGLDELVIVLQDSFLEDFGVDFCSLLLFSDGKTLSDIQAIVTSESNARMLMGDILDHHKATCGPLPADRARLLFPEQAAKVRSAAIMPLRNNELLGVLAIGSEKAEYFDRAMGSLFLSYISDCLCRLLPLMMAKEQNSRSPA